VIRPFAISCLVGSLVAFAAPAADPKLPSPEQIDLFEKKVRPILAEHCFQCHGPKKQQAGLRLDSRAALLKGSDNGPVVEPGAPEKSLLIEAIRQTGAAKKMPPKSKLKDDAIEALTAWIKMGVPWPETATARHDPDAWKRHWAFQSVKRIDPPVLQGLGVPAWPRNAVDHFILAKLQAKGLTPSPAADRRTLIRRLYFDLIGLPPSPEEIDKALSDSSAEWYEKLVDKLLASPHYGERWGRHWLDVARYADTKGYIVFGEDPAFPWAYTYRDYVVRAFNEDLPYDRFILEQLAADRLPLGADKRALTALGFITLGGRFMSNPHDILDDRIDVVSRGLMGLTVSCARCHDHKFDPIPSKDYYSLYGVFASSVEPIVPPLFAEPPPTAEYAAFDKELRIREKRLTDFVQVKHAALVRSARLRAGDYLLAAHTTRDHPDAEDFMFVAESGDLNPRMVHRWQVFLERTRKQHDPIFAPWHAFAALPEKEFAAKASALSAQLASPDPARPLNPLVVAAFVEPPKSMAEVARRYGELFQHTEQLWDEHLAIAEELGIEPPKTLSDPAREELRQFLYGPAMPPQFPLSPFGDLDLLADRASQGVHSKLRKELEEWRVKGPGAPPRANTLEDTPVPFNAYVFLRGNPSNRGEAVRRQFLGFPSALSGQPRKVFAEGSGRLELAKAIADRDNPLTARVLVNRVWMHHFNSPLVATPGDFGTRSEPPAQPELLDYLAAYFVDHGWSIKQLHRLILLSAAYQQASADRPDCQRVDPENALVWKMNRRRLDFEALRDSLLAVAGTLDRTVGGPPVKDIVSPNAKRRTLYGFLDRQTVPGLYRTFDFPSPDATAPKRDNTTVAPQALFLMNHPFALQAAKKTVQRPEVANEKETDHKLARLYRVIYGREPTPRERALAQEYLTETGSSGWERLAQALLMANEFVFVD
jgi:hypothetical protein